MFRLAHKDESWIWDHWNPKECTIEPFFDEWCVLDHSIQTIVAIGSREECEEWLRNNSSV